MELSTTSTLALFETTKAQRQTFVQNIITEVREGNVDILKLHMQAKCNEQLLKELIDSKEYKSLLLEQAEKHGKKFEMYNSEFQVKEAGTKWDYSNCNDEYYNELLRRQDTLNKQVKEREKLLQTLPSSGMACPETGNMIYPASKSSTTIVQCTLK